jgi:hypothetical protein
MKVTDFDWGWVPKLPIWLMALGLAALAPWGARALQSMLERRVRRRTLALLAEARRHEQGGEGDVT